jgi:Uma2 family endonuclease
MSTAITQPPRKRFTRSEVDQMEESGLFAGQRLELIDGDLIDKMGQNPPHAGAIQLCMEALMRIFGVGLVRVQLPMEAGRDDRERSLPEPDVAVLLEAKSDFKRRRHPSGQELALVVEVADTTLRHDASTKRDLYARAGVAEYWILDLNASRLLVHRELDSMKGEYGSIRNYSENESVSGISVSSLLP